MDNPEQNSGAATPAPNDAARRLRDAAHNAADRAKGIAQDKIEASADKAASSLDTAAHTLRRAADDLSADHAWIGGALRKSAAGLEKAASSIEGGDLGRGLEALSNFARREPALFLGASLALGFALARVGKTALEQNADAADAADATRTAMG